MATLKQLKTFLAVAEDRKMITAAKRLYVSQPTVSQIILDLETEYNTRLFERSPKELKITPAGELLLNYASEIVAIHEHLEQSMKNINSLRPLRIGATITIGNTLMGTLTENLLTLHPDIDSTVFVENTRIIEHRILHNELDIALVEGTIIRQEIITEPVIADELCLICGKKHPFADKLFVTTDDLRNQNFIMRERGSGTRAMIENIMLTHHIPFNTKWECASRSGIIDAVRHNLGLGVLSLRCVTEYAQKGDIIIVPLKDVSMKRFFYLCHNQCHPITSQMKDFTDIVTTLAQKDSLPVRNC